MKIKDKIVVLASHNNNTFKAKYYKTELVGAYHYFFIQDYIIHYTHTHTHSHIHILKNNNTMS